jgi:AAA ATPase domain
MDPRLNPYAPGAGTNPPELAGRDAVLEKAAIALDRIRAGRAAQSLVLYGLRGVGKTVLLNRIRLDAESRGLESVRLEAPEERSLPAILAPSLRATLLRLNRTAAVKATVQRALSGLAGFIKALRVKYADIEVGLDVEPELGLADSGDLESDLTDLLMQTGKAAQACSTAIVIYLDELQYVNENELAALIRSLHAVSQSELPVTMIAAGLPQLLGKMGRAKSYAERLFIFEKIDKLDHEAARKALSIPVEEQGVTYVEAAVNRIIADTEGYPYFLQEWGKHAWDLAEESPIKLAVADRAREEALNELDASFFRVRFDRLTPLEKAYVRAMARLGDGPFRSGDVAFQLGRKVSSIAPVRDSLIKKGMIYAPQHGDTAFTVPLFGGFLLRTMPDPDPLLPLNT